ncbi:MAG: hypothetical protein K1W34_17065 [Lachnospiraceae bacterium]
MDKEQKKLFKAMTFGKKLEYLWMYYKAWFAGLLFLIAAVCLGITMYRGAHTTVLLNVAIVGGDNTRAVKFAEDFARYADITAKDGEIRVKANLPDESSGSSLRTALTTLMGADALDVLICSEGVYEEYSGQGAFVSTKDILGKKAEDYGDEVLADAVCVGKDSVPGREEMVRYDKIYAAVSVNSQNQEMAAEFLCYLLEK